MKEKAIKAILDMGGKINLVGMEYILQAMDLYENEGFYNLKTMALYSELAKRNLTTPSRIERSIRYAFNDILSNGNENFVKKYFPLSSKFANTNALKTFYLRLKQEEKEE